MIKSKMGRPAIDWDINKIRIFEVMIGLPFADQTKVADAMGVSVASLRRWILKKYDTTFERLIEQKRETLKMNIAAKQYEMAMKGNMTALIWLGKQWLGQKDKHETDVNLTASIKIDRQDENL